MRKYSEVVKELRSTMANEKTCLVGEQIPYSHASGDWNTLEDLAIAAMMRLEDLADLAKTLKETGHVKIPSEWKFL